MKFSRLNHIKRFNWVSLVQSCWVLLALFISMGQTKAQSVSDPTQPPEALLVSLVPKSEAGESFEWQLQGLKVGDKQSIAIVNGHWIAVGKEYQGYRLIKVTAVEAFFADKAGNKKTLSLGVKTFKTSTKAYKKVGQVNAQKER